MGFNFFRKPATTGASLHAAEAFGRVIATERMRCDRSGRPFTLAVFDLPGDENERREQLLSTLESRLRATDHAGFMDDAHAGVVLWDTDRDGATKYVDAILAALGDPHPGVKLFIYPSDSQHDEPPSDGEATAAEVDHTNGETDTAGHHEVLSLEMLFVRPLPLWKRAFDIVGATCGLIVLSPLLIATAIAIKLTSKGPVFFKQKRDGLGGRKFTILKFRTMCNDAEAKKAALRKHSHQDGPAFALDHDPRITRVGAFLRKTCIDELPQLWNVLKGDMTLVGPRPLDSNEAAHIDGWGQRRHEVTPGITCLWQVEGKPKRVPFAEWMRMDLRYLKRRTLLGDMKLIARTFGTVLLRRGAS